MMTAQQPAVVIIARHGPRLDAADPQWHLSTPTPYDPPLTYGGWNQCKALGVRIASLLHAREQEAEPIATSITTSGVTVHDFGGQHSSGSGERKRKRKHKIVIHSSPFLRCLQTSIAIATGMAQFQPLADLGGRPGTSMSSRSRTPNSLRSASPRLRAADGTGSPLLSPIPEPKHDFAHAIARKALGEPKRYQKARLRVDAFLGEWLNPGYFEHITPPPPSAMMVAAAKAELMQNEPVEIFTPTFSSKSSHVSLWAGSSQKAGSKDSALEDWTEVEDSLPQPSPRSRANSATSAASNESNSSRKFPFAASHHHHGHHPFFPSTLPKGEQTSYVPPTPQYAVSSSDVIPRGYVAHARNACVNVDYQWDSSRPPQDWGDGGEFGEEWSAMHKRYRRGLNHLIHWYSSHNADDRAEDSLGIEQVERHEDEEMEELVLILVTHGAGSNALIGALTGQPVLLDVGMASLTMAVRRDEAPRITTYASSTAPSVEGTPAISPGSSPWIDHARRGSLDLGLNSVYEMRLVSSSEHLRPGADPTRLPTTARPTSVSAAGQAMPYRQRFTDPDTTRNHLPASFGSVRRPSLANAAAPRGRTNTAPVGPPRAAQGTGADVAAPTTFTTGLWTPPLKPSNPQMSRPEPVPDLDSLTNTSGRVSPGHDLVLDFSNSPPDSRPASSGKDGAPTSQKSSTKESTQPPKHSAMAAALSGNLDGAADDLPPSARGRDGSISDIAHLSQKPPQVLSRGLSQKGLWGSKPRGDAPVRRWGQEPKRRWTVNDDDGAKPVK